MQRSQTQESQPSPKSSPSVPSTLTQVRHKFVIKDLLVLAVAGVFPCHGALLSAANIKEFGTLLDR